MEKVKLAIGLRVYEKSREALVQKMRFLENVPWGIVEKVFVAVNVEKDRSDALEYFKMDLADPRVEAFPVQPWFKTGVPALNAIIHKATAEGLTHIWFVSTRLVINENIASILLGQVLDKSDYDFLQGFKGPSVVGAVMPGHHFQSASSGSSVMYEVNGETVPYNTCAVWDLKYLYPIGFLPVSEMPIDTELAGVEEAATILIQKKLFYTHARTVLIPDIVYQTGHWDEERKERNKQIVSTKDRRVYAQRQLLDPGGYAPLLYCVP